MASLRAKTQSQVGSAQWVFDERKQARQFVDQEAEEFTFSARNEMEWLNEHMAEIFSGKQLSVTDIFKTPGKLRGKTPRTARKRNPLETRAPLTDVFTATPQQRVSPVRNNLFVKQLSPFKIADDKENEGVLTKHTHEHRNINTDSGYHGMTDRGAEHDPSVPPTPVVQSSHPIIEPTSMQKLRTPLGFSQSSPQRLKTILMTEASRKSTSHPTFISAKETPTRTKFIKEDKTAGEDTSESKTDEEANQEEHQEVQSGLENASDYESHAKPVVPSEQSEQAARTSHPFSVSAETDDGLVAILDKANVPDAMPNDVLLEDSRTPSESSSIDRPVIRKKSSLNFASLPAREPLTTKKSLGFGQNQANLDSRGDTSNFERPGETSNGDQRSFDDLVDDFNEANTVPKRGSEFNLDTKVQSHIATAQAQTTQTKTNTQRLHERITMLGKTNTIKSTASNLFVDDNTSREPRNPDPVPQQHNAKAFEVDDDDEDWIGPIAAPAQDNIKASMKSTISEPNKAQIQKPEPPQSATIVPKLKSTVAMYPKLNAASIVSTTPAGSPITTKIHEGPLSASKARLYSVFKSAKGIFGSSANASAEAKAVNASPMTPNRIFAKRQGSEMEAAKLEQKKAQNMATYPDLSASKIGEKQTNVFEEKDSLINQPTSRRSSARLQTKRKSEEMLSTQSKSDEDDSANALTAKRMKMMSDSKAEKLDAVAATEKGECEKPSESIQWESNVNDMLPPTRPKSIIQNPAELRRPGRPTKESMAKSKPAPVPIKVRMPAAAASTRPKALDAAARKKAEDEKVAEKKAEQKRELDRKRAVKVEEDKRAMHEQKSNQQQRFMEAKSSSQQHLAEQRRLEVARKLEQSRPQSALQRSQRQDEPERNALNGTRPVSREINRPTVPHINPAKPPKRTAQQDLEDDQPVRAAALKSAGAVHQTASKRRKTNEIDEPEVPVSEPILRDPIQRPTIGAPKRVSTLQKGQPNRFTPGYMTSSSQSSSVYNVPLQAHQPLHKVPTSSQYPPQNPKTPHMKDLIKTSNARIPFAETAGHTQSVTTNQQTIKLHSHQIKTPTATIQQIKQKLTPQYPNGDNIELPEIATDSEDSDEERDFIPPDWANSPALRELLQEQQLVDPSKIFGPIAPLIMEEVFRGNKERQAKFRNRTSSAYWGPDKLTEEETRKDQEARVILDQNKAWTPRMVRGLD